MTGHSTVEALAAAALLGGYMLLVRSSGLPRGWPGPGARVRALHLGPGLLAAAAAGLGAAVAAATLGSAPLPAVTILLLAAVQLIGGLRWLRRPRLATADGLVLAATLVACAWLIAWSGALPLAAHLEPGADQLAVVVMEAALVLWLTLGTRRPATAPAAGERVGWSRVRVITTARASRPVAPRGRARRAR